MERAAGLSAGRQQLRADARWRQRRLVAGVRRAPPAPGRSPLAGDALRIPNPEQVHRPRAGSYGR
ncbi:MAG: hypothetical protein EPN35_02670 [Rhodanobacter sp.]|nr:MAG: hypothetical protein EPN35_02670 [Rhodanobacter sp.]